MSFAPSAAVALASGLGQVVFTSGIRVSDRTAAGYVTCHGRLCRRGADILQHHHHRELLSDKREVDALHGRIAVGFSSSRISWSLVMIGLTAFRTGRRGHKLRVGSTTKYC